MRERWTESEEETIAYGAELARSVLPRRGVVLLEGNLGAGKTTLVKGIVAGRGGDPDEVSSPTFTLLHEYGAGDTCVWHADLYRLETPRELATLGLEETIDGEGLLVVEWGERFPEMWPAESIEIRIERVTAEDGEQERRRFRVRVAGDPASA